MVKLVFLGPPGAGKGTQASLIADFYKVPHISTGDILRSNVAERSPLGIKAKDYMDKGDLVPDQLILDMVKERLENPNAQNGWILDGFPRTVTQAEEFFKKYESEGEEAKSSSSFHVINLQVPDDVLVARLLSRKREDDQEETIRNRLQVYYQQTQPLIEFYQAREQLIIIDGNNPIETVTNAIKQEVDKIT
ncbi:Adenylate kinase [Trichodesmium erythraeum IMS101]|uniref:Adenylate kinase n=1 Tax=Trichodesmium erythraeum (strain IMS101) TaxID=203124 RepID=KAD_TRIEI|nr:RecName: Full=Adenylate kinase; Short=AK; AltName: Full=ATP-AMP transphosphorylase; AltName: Full=ATP:AMP phosphotransferase; AltName: Full=Adenylate monophosphate kinase [Trichodesmium erythraeum IMS101]MBS9769041.1 adenylate kinase [Trichodesmium erythraeum GBRTRLIN201]MCH2049902.1 adenylate kinase [Trichodesmium sp. ALOHA_ZT_67]MDE5094521.1 adenylate kinase [Trichodesmium sp. St11_bin5]MDT9341091.1 adenylate kinase [Trichodesmium erythraeum 21-75]